MSAPELKPCPFCGGEAAAVPDPSHSTGWDIGCFSGSCEIEPHVWAVHKSTAEMQWNTRTDTIPSDPRVKALVEALESIDQYGSDTLSGNSRGPDDRAWQREGVVEMVKRARNALAALKGTANE